MDDVVEEGTTIHMYLDEDTGKWTLKMTMGSRSARINYDYEPTGVRIGGDIQLLHTALSKK